MPPKIDDIARNAGVSAATVSRVLNGRSTVSEELRERVLTAVAKLGYEPNLLARGLRTRRTYVLGLVIPNIANSYFTDIARAAEDVALRAGYVVIVCSSDGDLGKEQRSLDVFRNRMVDGVMVAVADWQRSSLSALIDSEVPVVLIDRCLDGAALDSVTVDVRRGAYSAVSLLAERGYRRIAMLGGPANISTAAEKLEGYREAMRDYGLPITEEQLVAGDYTEAAGLDLGRRLLSLAEPPEAVLVANNLMTQGFCAAVRESGVRVPHDVAFVGFDDSAWASLVVPPVTVVDQPTYELGKTATEMLLQRVNGECLDVPRHVVLRTRLIIRGSC